MSEKLGSEFLKEFDKYERPFIFGKTKRQLVLGGSVILTTLLSVGLTYIHFPSFIIFILAFVILVPSVLYGLKKDIALRERFNYSFHVHTHTYQTNHNWKGDIDGTEDFKAKKGVTEARQDSASN
ncbi:PrgI family protein [Streptococcus dysgalactiae]|uniref:PrgI family protein n=1 Tax=Streptococcus dysgalactiae TaxID=1334 RepID=UPI0035CF8587